MSPLIERESLKLFMSKSIDNLYFLAPSSYCQMMGYVYHLNDKLIVIDGGTKDDYPELLRIVKECGNVIDLLIITHCHHDHIGALINIINNNEIVIKEIIYDFPELEVIKSILTTDWEYDVVLDFLKAVKDRTNTYRDTVVTTAGTSLGSSG